MLSLNTTTPSFAEHEERLLKSGMLAGMPPMAQRLACRAAAGWDYAMCKHLSEAGHMQQNILMDAAIGAASHILLSLVLNVCKEASTHQNALTAHALTKIFEQMSTTLRNGTAELSATATAPGGHA